MSPEPVSNESSPINAPGVNSETSATFKVSLLSEKVASPRKVGAEGAA